MKTVLIVDDDPDICLSLQLWLEPKFAVLTAGNGIEALASLGRARVDAIVLDLMMPVMDGAMLKQELDRRGESIPIVLVSARADVDRAAASLGVRDYLVKPVDPMALERVLEAIMPQPL